VFAFFGACSLLLLFRKGRQDTAAVAYMVASVLPAAIGMACNAQTVERVVHQNPKVYGVAAQVLFVLTTLMLRTCLCMGKQSDPIFQHRVYLVSFIFTGFFNAGLGYAIVGVFFGVYVPAKLLSWYTFHIHMQWLNASSLVSCAVIMITILFARHYSDSLNRANFKMAAELKSAQSKLEQVLSAQQTMLSSLFDASCICSDGGKVTQATPHMSNILGCSGNALVGKPVVDLVVQGEQERLGAFLDGAWAGGAGKASMIETSLRCCVGDRHCAGGRQPTLEVRLHCICLPGGMDSSEPTSLWMQSGMFIALQDVSGDRFCTSTDSSPTQVLNIRTPTPHPEYHIKVDAGQESLGVIKCSLPFACGGVVPSATSMLDMLPQLARKQFDRWVYEEVQGAPVGAAALSKRNVRNMQLRLPHGTPLVAQKVWIEFDGTESDDVDCIIPVKLMFSGLSVSRHEQQARGSLKTVSEGVSEDSERDDDTDNDDDTHDLSTVLPDDSASMRRRQVTIELDGSFDQECNM